MKKNWRELTAILLASAMIASTGSAVTFAEGETQEIAEKTITEEVQTEKNSEVTEDNQTEENNEVTEENQTEENNEVTEDDPTEEENKVTEDNQTEEDNEVTEDNQTEEDNKVTEDNQTEEDNKVTEDNQTEEDNEVTEDNQTEEDNKVTEDNQTEENNTVTEENKTEESPAENQQTEAETPKNEEEVNADSEEYTLQGNARYVNIYDYQQEVIRLVNVERAKESLSALKEDANLAKAASLRATEIVENTSHTRPNGSDCFTAIENMNDYVAFGENIAYGQKTPAEVVNDWMNSPGHRANILDQNGRGFNVIGVGCYEYNNVLYWTQLFGTKGSNVSSRPVPTQVGTATATMSFGQTLDDITDTVTGISFVDMAGTQVEGSWSWVQGNQKLDVGTHEVQIVFDPNPVALFNTLGIVTVTVTKGSVTTIPTIPTQQVMSGDTETKYYDLSQLLPTDGGKWTYQIGTITDADSILNTPMMGTNNVLAYSVKAGAKPGQTAAIGIIASNPSSNDITLTVPISILTETYTCTLSRIPEKVIVGEDIDLTGITITTQYGSGKPSDTVAVTPAMLKGYDKTLTGNAALGQKTITVMPDANNPNRIATFSIKVEDIITDLKVVPPGKLKYNKGDNIDLRIAKVQIIRKSGLPSLEIPLTASMLNIRSVLDRVGTTEVSVTTDGGSGLAPFTKENAFEITVVDKFSAEDLNFSFDIDLVGADGGALTKEDVDLYMSGVSEEEKEATKKKVQELSEGKTSAHAVDISLINSSDGQKVKIVGGNITITINYSDIGMNPEDTNLMVYHYAQGVWETISGIVRGSDSFTLPADSLSPFVFSWDPQGSTSKPTNPTTPDYSNSSSSSNKGSGSGGGGSSSSSSKGGTSIFNGLTSTINSILKSKLAGNHTASTIAPVVGNTNGNTVAASPLTQTTAQTAFNQAVSLAKSKGIKEANISLKNISVVSAEILSRFASDMQRAGLQGVLTADYMNNGMVETRLSIPVSAAASLKKDFNLSFKQNGNQVQANFAKYYRNRTAVIPLAQEGSFGVPVSVATRISPPNAKVENLYFYSYNPATNSYQQLAQSNVFFDVNGYLHFVTGEGNYIIISDGMLQRK